MSDFHEFYEIESVGSTLLWDIWCSHEPMTLTEAVSYSFSDAQICRHLMYYVSSDLIIPVKIESEIGFVFNPTVEWVIAVGELVRNNTKEELEIELREADAEKRMYTDLYEYEDSTEYYEEESEESEMIEWFVAECRLEWVADAIEYYDLLDNLFSQSKISEYDTVSKGEVERLFVTDILN